MKFSTEVSEAHAAARVQLRGQEAADVYIFKLALRRFNNFFRTRHELRRSLFHWLTADLLEIRKKYFEERSLYSLFQNVIPEIIFDFLREIGVFCKI